ncbi:MAG TPA: SIS domain-containing protein [Gaiellales bacterium]
MTGAPATDRAGRALDAAIERRAGADAAFFAEHAARIATLCHAMAERFARGGRLIAIGSSPQDQSDVRHVAVEFVHPVIVGKRALPALGLVPAAGALAAQVELLAEADDIVIGFGADPAVAAAIAAARDRGCLTVAFAAVGAEWEAIPAGGDAFVGQELTETLYHLLWELVHVFFEHRGLLAGRTAGAVHDSGASAFLYPFLAEGEHDLDAVLEDVRRSVLMKADEIAALRERTLRESRAELVAAATALRAVLDGGGTVLAFGNGGSATDATDLVADLRSGLRPRRALDLTADSGILTALANDIGPDVLFARQVIAYGRPGDAVCALSTSGGSENIIAGLEEARRCGLVTVAMVGYDGGRIAAERLADHVVVTPSQHIPRIQEAQAIAYHALRELIELSGA